MANIETYYLVDFENVNEKGLESSDELGEHDHIYIFYTKNTPKISMEVLSKINKAKLHFYNIPVGKQSLDMSLVTVLGYLIGKNGSNCRYVIVSKDNDYKQSILLLKKLSSKDIKQQVSINSTSKNNSTQKSVKEVKKITTLSKSNSIKESVSSTIENHKSTDNSQKRVQLNLEVQKAIRDAHYPLDYPLIINEVASIVVKHYGERLFADNVYQELKETYAYNYLGIYNIVKPIIKKFSKK